jgi:hypothetical protein
MSSDTLEDARVWAASRHTRICAFTVGRTTRDQHRDRHYGREEYGSVEEARVAARREGRDPFGRPPVVYALTPEGWALPLEAVECE